ncbi:MAG TPA: NADP-dependent oxidoreductase [Terriglobales bacterium]|nr:NADP-dependent oxidoreductase [Terriglobales bacterium]
MKAVRIHAFGDSDQFKLEDLPRPAPRPDEVLVAIRNVGVNPVDWKMRQGQLARAATPFPLTMGRDFAGEVIEAGGKAIDFQPGERVFGFAQGAYAEFATVAAGNLAHMPANLTFDTAAALPTPGLTAYQLVNQALGLQRGQTVLIHGAGGAVGSLAVQLALHRGARVLATDVNSELGYVTELGAAQVFDAHGEPFEEAVGAVDAVLDLVGGETLRRSYAVVRRGGVVATTVGSVDEAEAERHGVRAVAFVMRASAEDLAQVAALASQGVLRPRIAQVLPLAEARRAQDLSQRGETHGKILLRAA